MKLLRFWEDFHDVSGAAGRKYYSLAKITWSTPVVWDPNERCCPVPRGWAGHGGVYAFTRRHWSQQGKARIAYVGKAKSFTQRLTSAHNHFNVIQRRGDTLVSCGRIAFDRLHSRAAYYLEIEDIVKFAVYDYLENKQGFETLPGFRSGQTRAMRPWLITNEGYLFGGIMPKRIVYPAVGIEFRSRTRS